MLHPLFQEIIEMHTGMVQNWRSLLTYPQDVPARTVRLLDTLQSVLPIIEFETGRADSLMNWLDDAAKRGILTPAERHVIAMDIGPNF